MLVPVDNLIPHRPPMRWIDALTGCTETTAVATVCLGADHFAAAGGAVRETALVECIAQTAAAAMGHRARERGRSEGADAGMLAAVSRFTIDSPPPVDMPLQIEVREVRRFGPMLQVSGTVLCEGRQIASGELTLYA